MMAAGPNIEIYRFHRDAVLRRHGSPELQRAVRPRSPLQDYFGADARLELLDLILASSLNEPFDASEWESFYEMAVTRYDHDSTDLLPGFASLKADDYAGLIKNLLTVIADRRQAVDRQWIGVSESWNIDAYPALARAFADARFLIVLRDPRAVFNSLHAQALERPQLRAQILSYARHFRK